MPLRRRRRVAGMDGLYDVILHVAMFGYQFSDGPI